MTTDLEDKIGRELIEILNESEQYEEVISNAAADQLGKDTHAAKWKEIEREIEMRIEDAFDPELEH